MNPRSLIAAEILGRSFGSDRDVLSTLLEDGLEAPIHEAVLTALCEGWPNTEECKGAVQKIRETRQPLSLLTTAHVFAKHGKANRVVELLLDKSLLEAPERIPQGWSTNKNIRGAMLRPLLRRLSKDNEVAELMQQRLNQQDNAFDLANIPALLKMARGLTPELERWCLEKLTDWTVIENEDELTIATAQIRPIAQVLLEVLY